MDTIEHYKKTIRELETRISRLESKIIDLTGQRMVTQIGYWQNKDLNDIVEEIDGIKVVEEWRDITGYEGYFSVSDFGRIKSFCFRKRKIVRILNQCIGNHGYIRVSLCRYGTTNEPSVHSLVAAAFLERKNQSDVINHLNGCRHDNRKINLEYCTISENAKHAYRIGLLMPMLGEKNGCSKLTTEEVLEIFNSDENQYDLAKKYGVRQSNITQIKTGKLWSHLTGKVFVPKKMTNEVALNIFNCELPFDDIAKLFSVSKRQVIMVKGGWKYSKITGMKARIRFRKFMSPQVINIVRESKLSNIDLAAQLGYSLGTISLIKSGRYFIKDGSVFLDRY